MNVCVIGAGYVGLTTSTVLANYGHHVTCVDQIEDKVNQLGRGEVPIYEPGLEEMLQKNIKSGHLTFTTNLKEAVKKSTLIFIAVGTPQDESGKTDLRFFENVTNEVIPLIDSYKVIITKSTVPVGTNEELYQKFMKKGVEKSHFDIVSNPEFLREGTAINDMLYPDKIVVGTKEQTPIPFIKKLYSFIEAPYIITSLSGAEMIKYASNAFLALKVSFINELAKMADRSKVDITDVAYGIGLDPRIGHPFLQAGLGYGGSCLPKDLSSLEHQFLTKNITPQILQAAQKVNNSIISEYIKKMKLELINLQHKKITVWGATFKPNTDDTRHSQALKLVEKLVEEGAEVHLYDPMVTPSIEGVTTHTKLYDSIEDSELLVIATEWSQFVEADWERVKRTMTNQAVLDCRNCLEPSTLEEHGIRYRGVAR